MFTGWLVLNWGDRWGASGIGRIDRCAGVGNSEGVVSRVLMESIAAAERPRCPTGLVFGTFGSERCSISEVYDGTCQVDTDPLTRLLPDKACELRVVCYRLNLHIIHQIRALHRIHIIAIAFKLSKRSSSCRICSSDWILRDMYVRILYVRQAKHPASTGVTITP